ncbi:MAG: FMN-binding protein, partial [Clostridia bacterium]|nr:FMN-binding protein [Clostridia bacterium]
LNPKETITGATVTSNAIKKGVEKAVEAVTPIMNGGD